MEKHGSESYFVIGEGLLGETVGGRDHTLAAPEEALVPPFRFSRMGPSGLKHQIGVPSRRRTADAMATGQVEDTETKQQVKSVLLEPQAIFPENVKDVVADGFVAAEDICTTSALQKACAEYGVE
jgi:hypothetical protein